MKLSMSNIAWVQENDARVYAIMKKFGFNGLEIAPTRIFPKEPYDRLKDAENWAGTLLKEEGFEVSSMQSVWYGRKERLFGNGEEREALLAYTKKAIDFAEVIGCHNLVFGCPRNRIITNEKDEELAVSFFTEVAEYAQEHHTVFSMEANPVIYGTNYINTTREAFELVKRVDRPGFRVNLDTGTMIENQEDISILDGKVCFLNHVHISEPNLRRIEQRELHERLAEMLRRGNYCGFVSVEMGKQEEMDVIEQVCSYVREVF